MSRDFKKLKVWEKSHKLTLEIYKETKNFPKEELYGLISQIRRSTASIASNIAEGCGKESKNEFKRYLQIAFSSASETEYHLLLANDLGYLNNKIYCTLLEELVEIKQMLFAFIKKLTPET